MQRGHYNAVPNVDRQCIINAHINGRDFIHLAGQLGIARQTARDIVAVYERTGRVERLPRGGRRRIKTDDEMMEFLVAQVEEKPTVTLRELNQKMRVQLDGKPHVSEQAISKRLDGLLYTVKMIRAVPIQWNTPERS